MPDPASGVTVGAGSAAARVPVRPASTVMLVRDGSGGVEVFTLQRVSQMAFAAGMTVFPGGGVDPRDRDPSIGWAGPSAAWWAEQWGIDEAAARSQVVAAVRELYEETGVLLAAPAAVPDSPAELLGGPAMMSGENPPASGRDPRAEVTAHRASLADILRSAGRPLRADLLRPWARWITPPGPSRRYDTFFFLAALPNGQRADFATSEASGGGWFRPADLLRAGRNGEIGLMPPTLAMLTDLARADSVHDLLAASREVRPVTPQVLTIDGEVLHVRVGDREYRTRLRRG